MSTIGVMLFFPQIGYSQADSKEISATSISPNQPDTVQILNSMRDAVIKKDYEFSFLNTVEDKLVGTFKYRHIVADDKTYAQLIKLEGLAKEIIQKDNVISYYQQDHASFSMNSFRMVDAFPDVIFNDFNKLNQYYDYFFIGNARVANRSCQLIRILAKDKNRYSYILWLDDETRIPLRIDLYDLNNGLLAQFKVVDFSPSLNEKNLFLAYLNKSQINPLVVGSEQPNTLDDQWQLNWIPSGFTQRSHSQIDFNEHGISSRLYSDGVFSFTVNVSENTVPTKSYSLQKGEQTIFVTQLKDKEIMIIGNLPLTTITKIAQDIEVKTSR
ncbi:MucB/RseB C-terminal domain-containing protein [Utexia brackfieldae]|uniref:MucB/RseB C-terminal domain-containing protein n=1 Tax=Utexia brackfieldae TaxID=3074108 RepID=UPI00370D73E5